MNREIGHSRPQRHSSEAIEGTACNGCRCMHVVERKRKRGPVEEFWCDRKHARVDPFSVECDFDPGRFKLKGARKRPI